MSGQNLFDELEPETEIADHDYNIRSLIEELGEIEYQLIEAKGKRYKKLLDDKANIEIELEESYNISGDELDKLRRRLE